MTAVAFARVVALVSLIGLAGAPAVPAAASRMRLDGMEGLAAAAVLERLLPALPGWTRLRADSDRVALSEKTSYTYAYALYMKDGARVRVTLADTAGDKDALKVVATMVTTLPDGYATPDSSPVSIRRLVIQDWPAAMRWDPAKLEGELSVVVSGRFVINADGTGIAAADVLTAFVTQLDLAALGRTMK